MILTVNYGSINKLAEDKLKELKNELRSLQEKKKQNF